jgi:hypothetical protein
VKLMGRKVLAFWSFVWSLVSGLCVSVQSQKAGGARYVQKKTLKSMSGVLIRPYFVEQN